MQTMTTRGFLRLVAASLFLLIILRGLLSSLGYAQVGGLNSTQIAELALTLIALGLCGIVLWVASRQAQTAQDRRQMLENMWEAVIATDAQAVIRGWNGAAERMYGWREDEVLGKMLDDVINVQYPLNNQEEAMQAMLRHGHWRGEVVHHHRSGRPLNILATIKGTFNKSGQITHMTAILLDVTEQRQVEKQLAQQERKLSALLRQTHVALLSVSHQHIITDVAGDGSIENLIDMTPEELVGKNFHEVFRHLPRLRDGYQRAADGQTHSELVELSEAVYDLHYSPQQDNSGVLIVVIDITERQATDDALQRYAIRLETMRQIDEAMLAAAGSVEIAETTLEYLPYLTPYIAACIFTLDNDQAAPIAFMHYRDPQQPSLTNNLPATYLQARDIHPNRVHVTTLDHAPLNEIEQFFYNIGATHLVHALLVHSDENVGVFFGAVDDSKRLNSENQEATEEIIRVLAVALKQARFNESTREYTQTLEKDLVNVINQEHIAKARAEAILQGSSDAILLTDGTGHILQRNRAFESLFPYPADQSLHIRTLIQPKDWPHMQQVMEQVIEHHQPRRLEVAMVYDENPPFPAAISLAAIPDVYNGTDGLVMNLRDISEQKRDEADLRRALESERYLSNLRSRFVSTVSHEFRNPLAIIQSSTDLIDMYASKDKTERIPQHTQRIQESVETMGGLLEDVLDLQRVEAHDKLMNVATVDAIHIIHSLVESVQLATGGQTIIALSSHSDSQPIAANEKMLRQILNNLLTNAVKYSPPGKPVTLRTEEQDGWLIVTIRDEGIGIPAEDQAHIFEPFYRARNISNEPGTGLGLAIVKRAVELHNGSLTLESTPGEGTTFIVRLPIKRIAEQTQGAVEP